MSTSRMKKKGGKRNKVDVSTRLKPPQIAGNVKVTRTYRYRSTTNVSQEISQNELINALGVMQTTATTQAYSLFTTVKVHRVSIWTPPDVTAGGSNDRSCTLTWNSPEGAVIPSGVELSDSTISTAFPAHVSGKPPAGSLASFWLTSFSGSTALNLFTIQCATGSIIDVHVTAILSDQNGANTLPYSTSAGPGVGIVWYPPLDGPTDVYQPVGLQTFT